MEGMDISGDSLTGNKRKQGGMLASISALVGGVVGGLTGSPSKTQPIDDDHIPATPLSQPDEPIPTQLSHVFSTPPKTSHQPTAASPSISPLKTDEVKTSNKAVVSLVTRFSSYAAAASSSSSSSSAFHHSFASSPQIHNISAFRKFNAQSERQRWMDIQKFQYPNAILLSKPTQLQCTIRPQWLAGFPGHPTAQTNAVAEILRKATGSTSISKARIIKTQRLGVVFVLFFPNQAAFSAFNDFCEKQSIQHEPYNPIMTCVESHPWPRDWSNEQIQSHVDQAGIPGLQLHRRVGAPVSSPNSVQFYVPREHLTDVWQVPSLPIGSRSIHLLWEQSEAKRRDAPKACPLCCNMNHTAKDCTQTRVCHVCTGPLADCLDGCVNGRFCGFCKVKNSHISVHCSKYTRRRLPIEKPLKLPKQQNHQVSTAPAPSPPPHPVASGPVSSSASSHSGMSVYDQKFVHLEAKLDKLTNLMGTLLSLLLKSNSGVLSNLPTSFTDSLVSLSPSFSSILSSASSSSSSSSPPPPSTSSFSSSSIPSSSSPSPPPPSTSSSSSSSFPPSSSSSSSSSNKRWSDYEVDSEEEVKEKEVKAPTHSYIKPGPRNRKSLKLQHQKQSPQKSIPQQAQTDDDDLDLNILDVDVSQTSSKIQKQPQQKPILSPSPQQHEQKQNQHKQKQQQTNQEPTKQKPIPNRIKLRDIISSVFHQHNRKKADFKEVINRMANFCFSAVFCSAENAGLDEEKLVLAVVGYCHTQHPTSHPGPWLAITPSDIASAVVELGHGPLSSLLSVNPPGPVGPQAERPSGQPEQL